MAFNRASSSSSFSSSFTDQWAHNVFLSFRGQDTRNNFTAHLYAALRQNGINTYIDNDLERGENISPALLNAIKESRISVIVLSQNYASSSWCLDELATILECKETKGQIVLPVFYNVTPSEVRRQNTESFKKAFANHEERFKDDQMKVQRWKTALTKVADLSGYDLGNRKEPKVIEEIIEKVNSILVKETKFQVGQDLVGIESQVQAVKLLLDIEKKDRTCMVGIFGTGGIGKTTLARVIFNSIAFQFEDSCFLRDIRETSCQKDGMIHLQNKLLSKILGGSSPMVDDDDQGVTLIEERFRRKRILLVLDDVDQSVQLEKLAGKTDWFGLGSKIIITTRDKHLLHDRVDSAYEVKLLDHHEALQLFSWNAFKCDKPNVGYEEVTEDAVSYCGGLPLALTVLGSALKGRDIAYWKSKLDKDKRIPDNIQKILRISYDGLEVTEKDIFLDIACFFKRKKLEECPFFPYHAIQELVNKSLISIDWLERLIMHDLLQEVGREIVRQESPEPGKRSRLWFHEDVRHVLEDNTGTNKVKGILIEFPEPDQIQDLSLKAFEKMKMLKYIINRNVYFSEELTFLSNELQLIDWFKYPGESFPSNFRGRNLFVLEMCDGHLRELKGLQHFKKLTTMNFSCCDFLEKIPDVSSISNLESLTLHFCKNLVEVHRSVGLLDKLVKLKVESCKNLVSFPTSLKLRSLKSIYLCGSPRLKNFPKIECKMECLDEISSDYCNMKEVSSSICLLLEDDRQSIEKSSISSGTELLQHLPLTNTSDSNDHYFSNVFPKLRCAYLRGCVLSESKFFRAFGCASTLSTLDLTWSDIVSLPRDIESFVGLENLDLMGCKQLKEILGLPPNVKSLQALYCESLEIMRWDPPEPVGVEAVSPTQQPSNRFLQWEYLNLRGCIQLREISKLPPSIDEVNLSGCMSLERLSFNNIGNDLPRLYRMNFSNCPEHIGNDLQIQLFSEGYHNKFRELLFQLEKLDWIDFSHKESHVLISECIYPGNMIPDCFSYRKEVLNTNSCEIDISGPQPFDFKNTIFAFSAVIGFGTEDGEDEDGDGFGTEDGEDGEDGDGDGFGIGDGQYGTSFRICAGVINDGQKIFSAYDTWIKIDKSNHVWLHYEFPHSQLKTNNFRVEFSLRDVYRDSSQSVFFKSCGFHLIHRNEEKAVDSMDGIQHSKRHRDDDDDGNLESKMRQLRISDVDETTW